MLFEKSAGHEKCPYFLEKQVYLKDHLELVDYSVVFVFFSYQMQKAREVWTLEGFQLLTDFLRSKKGSSATSSAKLQK